MRYYWSPISIEAMHAVYSLPRTTDNGFCCSVSQVGPNAYTDLTYERFNCERLHFESKYGVKVIVERDHLGRNGEDMGEWISEDKQAGFDGVMLHVHETSQLAELHDLRGLKENDKLEIQLGPGEDDTRELKSNLMSTARSVATWFSFPTGCLIQTLSNRSRIDYIALERWRKLAEGSDLKFRAHNCDYLNARMIREIKKHFDGMNIAPQLGTIQSAFYLKKALEEGYPIEDWIDACYQDDKNIARWCDDRPYMCVLACGHYHYDLIEWREYGEIYNEAVATLKRFMEGVISC